MNDTERTDYDALFDSLCAGLGIVCSPARRESYWTGLSKMSLIQFSRVVDHCLSEQGPDKFPTVPGVWKIWRSVQAQSRRPAPGATQNPVAPMSFGLRLVNQMFLAYLMQRRVVDRFKGDLRIEDRRRECLELAQWFDGMKAEGMLPTLAECKEAFARAMERIKDRPLPGLLAEIF